MEIGVLTRRTLSISAWRHRLSSQTLMLTAAVVAAVYFLLPPIFFTIFTAFRGPADYLPFEPEAVYSWANFTHIYNVGSVQSTMVDTTIFVLGSVALAFLLGFVLAWLVERTDMPFRNLIWVLVFVPLFMPGLVTTIGWIAFLGERQGIFNVALRSIFGLEGTGPITPFSMYGMIFVQAMGQTFLIFLFMSAALRAMDTTFEEASRASGASFLTTVRRITIPVLRPSVLAVLLLGWIFALESFEVPMLLSSSGLVADIMAARIWFSLNPSLGALPHYGEVAAMGVHFLVLTYFLFYFYMRATRQAERFATVTTRGFRPRSYSLGRWRWLVVILVFGLLFIQVGVPLLTLIWSSFFTGYVQPSAEAFKIVNLNNYRTVLADQRLWPAFINSSIIAFSAATISVTCALIIAWAVTRAQRRHIGHTVLDLFTSSSLAIPSVVAATGFLLFYLSWPSPLPKITGTMIVLILVYSYRLALAYRINRAGIFQIHKELEEQSATSGGAPGTTLRRIVLPLIAPNVLAAWALLFLAGFREFTIAMFLAPFKPITTGVLLWRLNLESQGEAAAFGVMLAGALFVVIFLLRFVGLKGRVRVA